MKPIPIIREKCATGSQYHAGALIGCATVWFATAEAAAETVKRLGRIPSGRDAGKCRLCKANYNPDDPRYKHIPYQYACENYKAKIAGASQK
jgi:hypothetical protein